MLWSAQAIHHRHPFRHGLLHLLWYSMQLGRGHRQHGQQPHHLQRQQGGHSGEWQWSGAVFYGLHMSPYTQIKEHLLCYSMNWDFIQQYSSYFAWILRKARSCLKVTPMKKCFQNLLHIHCAVLWVTLLPDCSNRKPSLTGIQKQ